MDVARIQAGILTVSRGLVEIAEALGEPINREGLSDLERDRGLAREWGTRGLDAREAVELCARWGFPGQKISAWVRGDWAEMRGDRRYLTQKSLDWLQRADEEDNGTS